MGIRKQAVVWAAIFAILFLGPGGAAATTDEIQILTTGVQSIAGEKIPEARQAAVSEALKQAVTQAFARVVPPRTFADNLEFLYSRILPSAEDYISTFRVLGEATYNDTYLVGVESRVQSGLLAQVLAKAGIFDADADRPRILLLIAEQTVSDLLPRYWWGNNPEPYHSHAEIQIADQMTQNGFNVVALGEHRPDPRDYGIQFRSIYDTGAAVDLAQELDADLVMLGRAGATESGNSMDDETVFDAVVRLTMLDATTGKPVADGEHQAAAKASADQSGDVRAIARAVDLAYADLSAQLDQSWARKQREPVTFTVRIQGNQFLPRFIALEKRFAEMTGIQNVVPREIGSDQAVLEMVYEGSTQQFARHIMRKTFDGFAIEIAELTETDVRIRFIDETNTGEPGESPIPRADNEKIPQ
jgi:alpha-D-ribose 1-methylphosphonate 5-triphosphate synthase subunit PhnG